MLAAQAAALIAAEHGERGRLPLLVIDEAHLLGHAQLEAIRLLTNAEMDAASPLACLLIGQPTLQENAAPGRAGSPRPADRTEVRDARHDAPRRHRTTSPTT